MDLSDSKLPFDDDSDQEDNCHEKFVERWLSETYLYPNERTVSKTFLNKTVINKYRDVNIPINAHDDTLLHIAVRFNKQNLIKWLVEKKIADINKRNKLGYTPLHDSIMQGNEAVTILLLKHNADIKIANMDGENPLHIAARTQPVSYLKAILDYCDEEAINLPSRTFKCPLHYLMENKNANLLAVKMFVEKGADINSNGEIGPKKIGDTLEDYIDELLNEKAIWQGWSPLHYFITLKSKNMPLLYALLTCGADVNAGDRYGTTPLNLVLFHGSKIEPAARLLLRFGADVNKANCVGETPFNSALNKNYIKYVKLFLHHGADLDKTDDLGNTPLHAVSSVLNNDLVKLLLKYGADVNITNKHGYTPYHVSYPENTRCRHCMTVFKTLSKHVVAMSLAKKFVCRGNLSVLKFEKRVQLKSTEQCAIEVNLLQTHVVDGTDVNLFQIAKLNHIGGYACNQKLVDALKRENMKRIESHYPVFYPIIFINMGKILLLNKLHNLMEKATSDFDILPIICVDKILDFLSMEDIRSFIRAFPKVYANYFYDFDVTTGYV